LAGPDGDQLSAGIEEDTVPLLRARLERIEQQAASRQRQLERYAADYPVGPHDQPQSMCPAFGSLRVGLRMRRTAMVLSGSACCVYGLTFTSHFYGAKRSVGYVPFNSETLVTGKLFGWIWMDPMMGIVGSLVIARWSVGLLRQTSAVLLDGAVPERTRAQLRRAMEETGDVVSDLHVWQVGPGRLAAVATVVTDSPRRPEHYKSRMEAAWDLAHVTVEVNPCDDGPAGHTGRELRTASQE